MYNYRDITDRKNTATADANITAYEQAIADAVFLKSGMVVGQTPHNYFNRDYVDGINVGIDFVKIQDKSGGRFRSISSGFVALHVGRRWNKYDRRRTFKETKDHTMRIDEIADEIISRVNMYRAKEAAEQARTTNYKTNDAAVTGIRKHHNIGYGTISANHDTGKIDIKLSGLDAEKAEEVIKVLKKAGII